LVRHAAGVGGERLANFRVIARLRHDAQEEMHLIAIEHERAHRLKGVGLASRRSALRLMRLRMRRFQRGGEQIRLARKIIGQMRLPQSRRGGDAGLGQRCDALFPDNFERSVQNALARAFFHRRHSNSFNLRRASVVSKKTRRGNVSRALAPPLIGNIPMHARRADIGAN